MSQKRGYRVYLLAGGKKVFTRFSDLTAAITYASDSELGAEFISIEAEVTEPLNEAELRQLERQLVLT